MDSFPTTFATNQPELSELHRLYGQSVDSNGQPPPSLDHAKIAQDEAAKMGDSPSLSQVTATMLRELSEFREEVKVSHGVLAKSVGLNSQNIELQSRQINWLKGATVKNSEDMSVVNDKINSLDAAFRSVQEEKQKLYKATCEVRQRGVKGNFILNGPHVPKPVRGENLFDIVSRIIWDKYGVPVDWYQLSAMHRLPGGGVILVTNSRLPGSMHSKFMEVVNKNPNRHIQVYLNIQLMEPYDALYFLARKLKQHKVISNYRIDENGYTWIALSEDKNNFKLTSATQILKLGVEVPESIKRDMKDFQTKKAHKLEEVEQANLQRAVQPRQGGVARTASGGNREPLGTRTNPVHNQVQHQEQQLQEVHHEAPTVHQSHPVPPPQMQQHASGQQQLAVRHVSPVQHSPSMHPSTSAQPPPLRQQHPVQPQRVSTPAPAGPRGAQSGSRGSAARQEFPPPGNTQRIQSQLQSGGFQQAGSHSGVQRQPGPTLHNPYMSDLERKAYNLADELGLHPGAELVGWELGID